jgi:biotin carboxylase
VERNPAQPGGPRRLLVLGAGPGQLGLLEAARKRGLFVIAVDRDPRAPGFRYADRRAIVSVEDEPALERLAEAERVDAVIAPGIDWPVGPAARIASRFRLPHPISPASAVLSTSKLRQRERFEEAGVPQTRWKLVTGPDEELGFPCVVKAPDRQGQRGLSLVREPGELEPAVRVALRASRSGLCLIEELVDGPEVTVNAFSRDGVFHQLTVTDRITAEPPAFGVALAHVWHSRSQRARSGPVEGARGNREVPSAAGESSMDEVVAVAELAARALGIENGPTYTQLRIGPDGPRVIELAARLGGGHDAELCEAALGIDLNGLALSAVLGEEIHPARLEARERVGGACVRFLVAPPGELREVEGVQDAACAPGVAWIRVYRGVGALIRPLRLGSDRAGAILATGETRAQALERATRAAEYVRFGTVDAEALV